MKYKSLLRKISEKETMLPPSSKEMEDEEVKIPPPSRAPVINNPTEEELEERAKRQIIYHRDKPVIDMLNKNKKFYEALEEMEIYLEPGNRPTQLPLEQTVTKMDFDQPTELYLKPTASRTDKLVKLCNYFYGLAIKL